MSKDTSHSVKKRLKKNLPKMIWFTEFGTRVTSNSRRTSNYPYNTKISSQTLNLVASVRVRYYRTTQLKISPWKKIKNLQNFLITRRFMYTKMRGNANLVNFMINSLIFMIVKRKKRNSNNFKRPPWGNKERKLSYSRLAK